MPTYTLLFTEKRKKLELFLQAESESVEILFRKDRISSIDKFLRVLFNYILGMTKTGHGSDDGRFHLNIVLFYWKKTDWIYLFKVGISIANDLDN